MNTQIICFKCDMKIQNEDADKINRILHHNGAKEIELGFIGDLPK